MKKTFFIRLSIFSIFSIITLNIHPVHAISLKFLGDQIFETGFQFKNTEVGGLSGITYSESEKLFYLISDDRSQNNDARFYTASLDFTTDPKKISQPYTMNVQFKDVFILKNHEQKPYSKKSLDAEGIVIHQGKLYISSEGDTNKNNLILPKVSVYSLQGQWEKDLTTPPHYLPLPQAPDQNGIRDNLGFESLGITPDGKWLFSGNEEALLQDGTISTPTSSSRTRVMIFDLKNDSVVREYSYELDPVPSIPVGGITAGETGIPEICPINDKEFLSLERSYLPLAKKTIVKIYHNKITPETSETLMIPSLKRATGKITPAEKTLVLNFNDIISQLNSNFQQIDNIEGMVFGPKLPNGNQTLILVSDNNFNKHQKTVFYAFEILP